MKHSLLAIVFLSTAALPACGRSGFTGSSAKPAEAPKPAAAPYVANKNGPGSSGGNLPESKNDADGNPADGANTTSGPTTPPKLPGTGTGTGAGTGADKVPPKTPATTDPTPVASAGPTLPVSTIAGPSPVKVQVCSDFITVAGQSNPWLAHAHDGATLLYTDGSSDKAPAQAPIPHGSACIGKGKVLVFETSSDTNHVGQTTTHNGEGKVGTIVRFDLGAFRGFSQIAAPVDSLVAVFISAAHDVAGASPATLNFDSAPARDFQELQPRLGQVFFIGDGRRSDGNVQRFVVPEGAAKIVFGNMDGHQWSNNVGSHKVRVNEVLP